MHLIKMNISTSFALLAVLAAVSTVTVSSAYAQTEFTNQGLPNACVGCNVEDSVVSADKILQDAIPISVWVDKDEYTHNDMIMLTGYVANPDTAGTGESQVTVMVRNSIGSIVTIDQIVVNDDKTFETSLNTAGRLWIYDGVYTIYVQEGQNSNKIQVELVGGEKTPTITTQKDPMDKECTSNDLVIIGMCVPYTIEGGAVTGATVNTDDMSLVIAIDATDDEGVLTLEPTSDVIDGIFMVLVDGEESNDYMVSEDGTVVVPFESTTEVIEVIGTYVIPEFGTIAIMILAIAIVSIIVMSSRTRLGMVMPRV